MFLSLLLLYLLLLGVEGAVKKSTLQLGTTTIVLIFNDQTILSSDIAFTSYDQATRTAYFQTVTKASRTFTHACRISSQQRIVVGPVGCSDVRNPQAALQTANCIPNEVEVELRRKIFFNAWYLSKDSKECLDEGGAGDIRLCAGPLRLARDNTDSFLPTVGLYSTRDYLSARMAFLDCLVGPYAMSPCVVRVRMVMPAIQVTVIEFAPEACVDPRGVDYSGFYSNWENDRYPGMITDVWKDFKSNSNQYHRLFLKRAGGAFSTSFVIALGDNLAPAGGFNFQFQTAAIESVLNVTGGRRFQNWVEQMPDYALYDLYNSTSGELVPDCILRVILPENPGPPQYVPPDVVNSQNYSYNINPFVYERTSVCNVAFGRLSVSGELMFPNCADQDVCGGTVRYVYPGRIDLAVHVPANPNLHFRLNCEEMYPKSATFADLNGVEVSRVNMIGQVCNAPFISSALILGGYVPDEKTIQCQKLGGYTVGTAQTMCARPITTVYCQYGWIYFDGKCFYKFDPFTEGRHSVPIGSAATSCTFLSSIAHPLIEVDVYLDLWLQNAFIYFRKNVKQAAAYRVPQFGSEVCKCYNTKDYAQESCACYSIETVEGVPIFPICYYFVTESSVEPVYSSISVSLETAALYTHGQDGPQSGGAEAICECFDGWEGKNCERPTCSVGKLLTSGGELALTTFFRKCYNKGRGSCFTGQERICQCNFPYGPSASIIPSIPLLYQHQQHPCTCPAGALKSGVYQIGDQVYSGDALYLPCSGLNQGICITDNSTNWGSCYCVQRPNLVFGGEEGAYDGQACSCPIPIQPYRADVKNGPINTAFCNHRGTCCPFGQTIDNPILGNLYASACFEESTGDPIQGCSCDNGWGGPACTCPTPFDWAASALLERRVSGGSTVFVVDFLFRRFIAFAHVGGCTGVSLVQLSNELARPDATVDCTYSEEMVRWECPTLLAYQFLVLQDGSLACTVEAYERDFEYCGANDTVNVFSGRFFDIPAYRGTNKNLEPQYWGTANFGCTTTDCMCNSNYGGALCALRVSSVRPVQVQRDGEPDIVQAKMYCGETTLVPDIEDAVQGRGQVDESFFNCSCNPIAAVDHTGKSGQSEEYFAGKACQCAMVENLSSKRLEMCAGHGVCEEAFFPYGRCEVDLLKYREDALYRPYVDSTSYQLYDVDMVAETDMYFLYTLTDQDAFTSAPTRFPTLPTPEPTKSPTPPTPGPTVSPTLSPTNPTTASPTLPTPLPTTRSPTPPTLAPTTSSPTAETALYLFAHSSLMGTGYTIGSRSSTTEACVNLYNAHFTSLDRKCRVDTIKMFITYSYSTIASFSTFSPTDYFPTALPLKSLETGITVTPTFMPYLTVVTNSMRSAGVVPPTPGTGYWWSGASPNGDVSFYRCNDWITPTPQTFGMTGLATAVNVNYISATSETCTGTRWKVCFCQSQPSPTSSPTPPTMPTNAPTLEIPTLAPTTLSPTTASPTTATPTVSPTTSSPTKNPTGFPTTGSPTTPPLISDGDILLFSNSAYLTGDRGNRATTTAYCTNTVYPTFSPVSPYCDTTKIRAFLTYSPTDSLATLPGDVGFSPAAPLRKLQTGQLFAPSWPPSTAPTGLQPMGIVNHGGYVWTGAGRAPAPTPGPGYSVTVSPFRCIDSGTPWTSIGFDVFGGTIGTDGLPQGWWGSGTRACNDWETTSLLCFCVAQMPTKSPTKNPTTLSPTTASPTTASPTTQSPTTASPTPSSPTTESPTTAAPTQSPVPPINMGDGLLFSHPSLKVISNFGQRWIANQMCTNVYNAYYSDTGKCNRNTISVFTSYSYYPITNLGSFLPNGPANTPIKSLTTGLVVMDSFTFPKTLTNSLRTAGVIPLEYPSSIWWSGTLSDGGVGNNCLDWTKLGWPEKGFVGSATAVNSPSWILSESQTCGLVTGAMMVCFCAVPPPTQSPTPPPATDAPTPPTTQQPTPPTESPTRSTTPLRLLYKMEKGSEMTVLNIFQNISYDQTLAVPTNVTLRGAVIKPVLWTQLTYRLFTPGVGTQTFTEPFCNPGTQPRIPGQAEMQMDGVKTCPTTQKCILTPNCADDLSPDPDYTHFPDLRSCYCSKGPDIDYPGLDAIPLSEYTTLQLFEGKANTSASITVPEDNVGVVFCNNFVERELNCQLARRNPLYQLRCADQPIGCYDQTLGRYFGGFWNLNPKYPYDGPYETWTYEQYKGIASTMNNLTYSLNGKLVDPWTPARWNSYYWFDSVNISEFIRGDEADPPAVPITQTYLQQMDPWIYLLSSFPPAAISFGRALNVLLEQGFYECYTGVIVDNNSKDCTAYVWSNITYNFPFFHRAGYEWVFTFPKGRLMTSANVTLNMDVPELKGIEVYDIYGESCGSVLSLEPGFFATGKSFTFICPNSRIVPLDESELDYYLVVRGLGLESVYDLPGATLNEDYLTSTEATDPLFPFITPNVFTRFVSNSWTLLLTFFIEVLIPPISDSVAVPLYSLFPRRYRRQPTAEFLQPFNVSYNYTDVPDIDVDGDISTNFAFAIIADSVLNLNVYPENRVLREVQEEYQTRPVNYSDPDDLKYLQGIWEVWMAPRFCGAEETQCETFQLGKCVVEPDLNLRWRNGGETDYEFVGQEGGCACFNTFPQGFYNPIVFCKLCVPGYGPESVDQLSQVLQANNLGTQTLTPEFLELVNSLLSPDGTMDPLVFERHLACRYPFGYDPVVSPYVDYNMCAGHGVFNETSSNDTSLGLVVWERDLLIACTQLSVGERVYTLWENTTSPFDLAYVDEVSGNILTVVGSRREAELSLLLPAEGRREGCILECDRYLLSYPDPFWCVLQCSDLEQEEDIVCVNPTLFSADSVYIPPPFSRLAYLENPFLLTLLPDEESPLL